MANQVTDQQRLDAIETLCLMVNQSAPRKAEVLTQDGERFTGETAREVIDAAIEHFKRQADKPVALASDVQAYPFRQ